MSKSTVSWTIITLDTETSKNIHHMEAIAGFAKDILRELTKNSS